MQQEPHQQAGRRRQVDTGADSAEDLVRLAHVTVHHGHGGIAVCGQRAQVAEHHWVVVDVRHPGARGDRPRRLVRVRRGRHAAAQVDELADARRRRPCHGLREELPVLPDHRD